MGDRVTVSLKILKEHAEEAMALLEESGSYPSDTFDETTNNKLLVMMIFHGVNYGNLDGLDRLRDHGIAYSLRYDGSYDWGPGNEHVRFTSDGKIQRIELSEADVNPPLHMLLSMVKDPPRLVEYIQGYRGRITPLPWDHQEAYGRLYRANRLLIPAEELVL